MFFNIYCTDWLKGGWWFSDEAAQSVPSSSFSKTYPEVLALFRGTIPWSGELVAV